MQFETGVHTSLVKRIQNRNPTAGQFREGLVDKACGPLRPRIEIGPGQRAGKCRVRGQPEVAARSRCPAQLLHCPFLAALWIQTRRREALQHGVIRGVTGYQLPLQMRRQLGHFESGRANHSSNVVAVGLALGGLFQIEQARIPSGNLHTRKSQTCGPARHVLQRVERRRIACKLRQKDSWSFNRLHCRLSRRVSHPRRVCVVAPVRETTNQEVPLF